MLAQILLKNYGTAPFSARALQLFKLTNLRLCNSYTALAASLTGRKLENDFGVNEASQPKQGLFNPSLLSVHDLLLVEGKNLSPWFQPLLHKTSIFYLG